MDKKPRSPASARTNEPRLWKWRFTVPGRDVIVVGGSAGGIDAAIELCRSLPSEIPAAIFLVIHLAHGQKGALSEILSHSKIPVSTALEGEAIRHQHVYVAPPDCHLLLSRERVRVQRGPRYNRHRPAIDPLFHSATRAFGPRVVGVLLSGSLDDGVSGLAAIQRRGGVIVVQDPETAAFPEMPQAALDQVRPDHVISPCEMGPLLDRLAREEIDASMPPSENFLDAEFSNLVGKRIDMSDIGKPSMFACPECNGVLWEVTESGILHFHCRIGHGFSLGSLLAEQDKAIEDSMWVALRALEENIHMRRKLAQRMAQHPGAASGVLERLEESERHAANLRDLLYNRRGRESEPAERRTSSTSRS